MSRMGTGHEGKPEHSEMLGHVVPMKALIGTWVVLMVLTAITVWASYLDLGSFEVPLALGIATVKSAFVVWIFMHLKYESPFYGFLLCVALVFVVLFLGLTMLDVVGYFQPA